MKTGLLWIAGIVGALAGVTLATHRRRERDRSASRTQPEPLRRWEGEGGAVKSARQASAQSGGS